MSDTKSIPPWAVLSDAVKAEARRIFLAEAATAIVGAGPVAVEAAPPPTLQSARVGVREQRSNVMQAITLMRSASADEMPFRVTQVEQAVAAATAWLSEVEGKVDSSALDEQPGLLELVSRMHILIDQVSREVQTARAKLNRRRS